MPSITFTCTTESGDKIGQFTLEDDMKCGDAKPLIEAQMGIPVAQQALFCNNNVIQNGQTLAQGGLTDGCMVLVKSQRTEFTSFEQLPPHIARDPKLFQETVRTNPRLLQILMHNNPTLAEAVLAEGTFMLQSYFQQQAAQRQNQQVRQNMEIAQLNADPFDMDAQKKIEDMIRQSNVDQSYEAAVEHMPEAFARVIMLYVPAQLNGKDITAFVDSGAQSTIMSESCARRIGLMRLIDTRFAGMAKGVGTAKIIGRVHTTLIKIGKHVLNCSITILEGDSMDFLFGLDMLKRHQICIDLRKNCLRIEDDEVPFLSEKDIPELATASPREALTSPPQSPAPQFTESKAVEPPASSSSNSSSSSSQSSSSSSAARPQPQSQPQQQPQQLSRPPAQQSGLSQTSISTLVDRFGVSRQDAIAALTVCGGNVELAANYLFQGSGGFGF